MKNVMIIILTLLLVSCKLTDTGGSGGGGNGSGYNQGELVLINKVDHQIEVEISVNNSSLSYFNLIPNQEYRNTWYDNDPIFTDHDGRITVRYSSQDIPTREIPIVLQLGDTVYRDIRTNESSFTLYNNSFTSLQFYLNDGSTSSNSPKLIQSKDTYVKTWDQFAPLYSINEGFITLTYTNLQGEMVDLQFHIPLGFNRYHQIDEVEYILKISNKTSSDAWYTLAGLSYPIMSPHSADFFYSQDFDNFNQKQIDYGGYHLFSRCDVPIFISSWHSTDFDIEPDGGAISLKNQSGWRIDAVYITETTNQSWGSDALSGYLNHNQEAIWTVTEGYWDMKIIDIDGNEYVAYDFFVYFDTTESFLFPASFPDVKETKDKSMTPFVTEHNIEFKGIIRDNQAIHFE